MRVTKSVYCANSKTIYSIYCHIPRFLTSLRVSVHSLCVNRLPFFVCMLLHNHITEKCSAMRSVDGLQSDQAVCISVDSAIKNITGKTLLHTLYCPIWDRTVLSFKSNRIHFSYFVNIARTISQRSICYCKPKANYSLRINVTNSRDG